MLRLDPPRLEASLPASSLLVATMQQSAVELSQVARKVHMNLQSTGLQLGAGRPYKVTASPRHVSRQKLVTHVVFSALNPEP